eukprot:6767721-Alexandrium_andersonii.AAC.1
MNDLDRERVALDHDLDRWRQRYATSREIIDRLGLPRDLRGDMCQEGLGDYLHEAGPDEEEDED